MKAPPIKNLGKEIDDLQMFLSENGELFKECYHINNSFIRNKKIKNASIQKRYYKNITKTDMEKYIQTLSKLKDDINFIVDTQIHLLTTIKEDPFTQYDQF